MNSPPGVGPDEADAFPAAAQEQLRHVGRYAVRAPSSHNSQPWKFRIVEDRLELYADRSRRLPVVDPEDRALVISCGAALSHLQVALRHFGYAGDAALLPDSSAPDLLASVGRGHRMAPRPSDHELFDAIDHRHTHRGAFDSRPVPDPLLTELRDDAQACSTGLHVVDDPPGKQRVAELVGRGDRRQLADGRFRRELASWVRSNYTRKPDGIPGYAIGLSALPSLAGSLFLRAADPANRQAAHDEKLATSAPALVLLTTTGDTPADWLAAGQALGTVLLRLTVQGLAASFLNQPIEVSELRTPLARLMTSTAGRPQLLLRIGYPTTTSRPTPRRTPEDVILGTAIDAPGMGSEPRTRLRRRPTG